MSRTSLPIVYEPIGSVTSDPSETPQLVLTAEESVQTLVCPLLPL